jgi:hypothetical protein
MLLLFFSFLFISSFSWLALVIHNATKIQVEKIMKKREKAG